ncbi:MAG: hypothetical protein PWQ48_817 [Thermotogaceae bacterium]|jgi:Zn-dependent protease|nr:hypothetical protein [Thermotogaceae bacterium]
MINFFRNYLKEILAAFPAVLFAIVIHEVSHGYVAYLLGDDTAKKAGRLTLNPLKHLDPIGTLMLVIFHFGWARPVPVNFWKLRKMKRDIILVSLAGPASNFLTAFLGGIVFFKLRLFRFSTFFGYGLPADPFIMYLCDVMAYLMFINLVLAIFNLIPIPPLDGSKIIMALLPERYMMWYAKYEVYGTIVLLVLVLFGIMQMIMNPVLNFFIDTLQKMFLR